MAGVCRLAFGCLMLTVPCTRWTEAVRLERDIGAKPASGTGTSTPQTISFQDEMTQRDRRQFLVTHNDIRAKVGATNMVQMVWSLELEKLANGIAKKCEVVTKISQHTKRLVNTWFSSDGLNTWNSHAEQNFNASFVVGFWAGQKTFFDYQNLGCSIGEQCMNYAQIVWSTASHVGCSLKYCPVFTDSSSNKIAKQHYVACLYGEGESKLDNNNNYRYPYLLGTPCSKCPTGFWKCVNGLCQTSPECETVVDCLRPSIRDHCLCRDYSYSAGRKLEVSFLFVSVGIIVACSASSIPFDKDMAMC